MSNREMNNFEQIITSIRNTLRVEGITGLDSINHCVAFLVCRYLTIEKCTEFNIPLEFAFENFLNDNDDHIAIGKFYNEDNEKDCLFVHLREILNFKSFKFKIKAPLNFINIYKKLDDINIDSLFNNIDIVGAIYELHLKTGTSSSMRDLGQFFTNREVIKYMIKLCKPKLKKNGNIETILDPSMGTGGFLSMSIKYLNNNFPNINWKINKKYIYGFDIDETVKDLSILNALLESGQIFSETFVNNDTLHNDYKLSDNILIDKVDIILANEPFGLKNIIHKNVCRRIKDLKIEGTKAEPLFLQLMMQSLNSDGRCAVIVPDGVLFNDAKLHKLTRKYLCENLRLEKVISLEDGLFLNTGVKSSILFFINDGKTKEVEFCKIKMSNDEIVEELIITIDIKKIKENDYSLFVNKYNKVEEEKIDGIEYKKISDICEFLSKSKKQASFGKDNGKYPFYTSSKDLTKYCDEIDYKDTCLIIGTGGNANIKINNNFSCSADNFVVKIKDSQILNYYLYYWFINNMTKLEDSFHGSTIKHLSKGDLENILIPIPQLSIQQLIVEALDSIYDTIEGNNKLIQNYEKIKKGIIWSNTLNVEKNKLEDIVENIKGGKLTSGNIVENSTVPFFNGNANPDSYTDHVSFDYKHEYLLMIKDGGAGKGKYGDNIGLGKTFLVNGKVGCTTSVVAFTTKKDILTKYLYYILNSNKNNIMDLANYGVGLGHISIERIKEYTIPIPSKEVQEFIVKECDYYENLINTLKKENEKLQNNKIIEMVLKSVSKSDNDSLIINETNSNSENDETKKLSKINLTDDLTEQINEINEIIDSAEEELEKVKPKKKLTKKVKSNNV